MAKKQQLIGKKITIREIQVLCELSQGKTYIEIATNLFIANRTARKHIENIYAKLEVHNRFEAVQKATHLKLI